MGLARPVFVEIGVHLVAERDDAEELAGGHALARFLGIELLDRPAQLGQVGADAGVGVDRLDRPVEEAIGGARGLGDFLAAHGGQRIDLLAEFGAVRIERGELVDELLDLLLELADLVALQWHQARGLGRGDRLERLGRLQLELGRGRFDRLRRLVRRHCIDPFRPTVAASRARVNYLLSVL